MVEEALRIVLEHDRVVVNAANLTIWTEHLPAATLDLIKLSDEQFEQLLTAMRDQRQSFTKEQGSG